MEWWNIRVGVPLELRELRRPTGEKIPGELAADPRDRPLLVARGVDAGPTPASWPRRDPGPGVREEGTAENMPERSAEGELQKRLKHEPGALRH